MLVATSRLPGASVVEAPLAEICVAPPVMTRQAAKSPAPRSARGFGRKDVMRIILCVVEQLQRFTSDRTTDPRLTSRLQHGGRRMGNRTVTRALHTCVISRRGSRPAG